MGIIIPLQFRFLFPRRLYVIQTHSSWIARLRYSKPSDPIHSPATFILWRYPQFIYSDKCRGFDYIFGILKSMVRPMLDLNSFPVFIPSLNNNPNPNIIIGNRPTEYQARLMELIHFPTRCNHRIYNARRVFALLNGLDFKYKLHISSKIT